MKITVTGTTVIEKIEDIMAEVVATMNQRIGVPAGTDFKIDGFEFKVLFDMDGETRYASVPRDVEGTVVNEIFQVIVKLDENGNVDNSQDNEEESFVDGYTLAQAVGKEYNYEGIESGYTEDEITEIDRLQLHEGDVQAIKYDIKGSGYKELVRHYKGDLLVAEYVLQDKE